MNEQTSPLILRVRAGVPPACIMDALTTPAAMTVWLAEHAEVSLPERYQFWGRYTPDGAKPTQRLVEAASDRLHFTWTLDGTETDVDISVAAVDDGTVVTVQHTGADPAAPGALGQIQTFWAATLANLVDYAEDRDVLTLTDLTSPTLRNETTVDAPVEAVFASLIDPEKVSAWFGFPTEIDPEIGGQYGFGSIAELEGDRLLSVDYGPMGVATWELEGSEGKTRIVLSQSGFDPGQPPYTAWLGAVSGLAELRRFHEIAAWQPIWVHDE